MKHRALAVLFTLACCALRAAEPNTIKSNVQYRLSWGDLAAPGEIVVAPSESRRQVHIATGAEQLLRVCRGERWQMDRHAAPTIGCRERTSPGMHIVFYKAGGASREAWVHFDLHGPQDSAGHLAEVLRNRVTFGRTSQYEVYRGLVRTDPQSEDPEPEPTYNVGAHARTYLWKAFGPGAVATALASGAARTMLGSVTGAGSGRESYLDRISTNLIRNAMSQSIEFGAAAVLQQDQGFKASGEQGFRRRSRYALYHSFIVPGRDGEELAFPRVAAALGTPWAVRWWHPGREAPPNAWVQSGVMLGSYVLRSYWAEFRPDVKRAFRKARGRAEVRSGS